MLPPAGLGVNLSAPGLNGMRAARIAVLPILSVRGPMLLPVRLEANLWDPDLPKAVKTITVSVDRAVPGLPLTDPGGNGPREAVDPVSPQEISGQGGTVPRGRELVDPGDQDRAEGCSLRPPLRYSKERVRLIKKPSRQRNRFTPGGKKNWKWRKNSSRPRRRLLI